MDFIELFNTGWWKLLILSFSLTVMTLWIIKAIKGSGVGFSLFNDKVKVSADSDTKLKNLPDTSNIAKSATNAQTKILKSSYPKWEDLLKVNRITMDTSKKIFEIERFDVISEQMAYTEQSLTDIRQHMRGKFLKLLKDVKELETSEGLISSHESKDYINILRIVTSELKDILRRIFLENHLLEMKDVDFENYIKRRVAYLNSMIVELLNQIYPADIIPSRERVYDANREISNIIDDLFEDVIRRGRIIAIEKHKEVIELYKKMDKDIKKIIDNTNIDVNDN